MMRVLCSIPFTVRVALWALAVGFALGVLTGYQVVIVPDEPSTIVETPDDARTFARISKIGRSETMHIVITSLLIAIAG
jgi:hypothetical protein